MKWTKINNKKIFIGLDYYTSGRGYRLNHIGALILFAFIPLALAGGWLVGKYLTWREKKMKKILLKFVNQRIN